MIMNLIREMASQRPDIAIDLLLIRASGPHLSLIPESVNLIKLQARHTLTAIPEITRYLREERPDVMLAVKDRAARAAVRARRFAKVDTRIVVRLGTNLSTALQARSALQRWIRTAPMKRIYQQVDAVVCVSEGVRRDTLSLTLIDSDRAKVIRNPVVTEAMLASSLEPVNHPWLNDPSTRTVMGIGRLSYQKNFTCLIDAFAQLPDLNDRRLIILGDGQEKASLELQADKLGVADKVYFAGFQSNPYSWLLKADLFVLSSRWEGSPNVLTEALALGVPCVSTLCPSGPDELLNNGQYGILVAVDDAEQLAKAMNDTLADPLDPQTLKQAVVEYTAEKSAKAYMATLGAH